MFLKLYQVLPTLLYLQTLVKIQSLVTYFILFSVSAPVNSDWVAKLLLFPCHYSYCKSELPILQPQEGPRSI